jgi:hypothetical protein
MRNARYALVTATALCSMRECIANWLAKHTEFLHFARTHTFVSGGVSVGRQEWGVG